MWFIKLLDKKKIDKYHPYGAKIALVRCDVCGKEYEKLYYNLRFWCICRECWYMKASQKATTHWDSKSRLYKIWKDIKKRCSNKNSAWYKNYWWRWIQCLRKRYEDFRGDMLESYNEHIKIYWDKETTIDRIDVNWDYCKGNCKWSTRLEQSNNRRPNRRILYKWRIYPSLSLLCKCMDVNYNTVYCRIYTHWWSVEDAIDKPIHHKGSVL